MQEEERRHQLSTARKNGKGLIFYRDQVNNGRQALIDRPTKRSLSVRRVCVCVCTEYLSRIFCLLHKSGSARLALAHLLLLLLLLLPDCV